MRDTKKRHGKVLRPTCLTCGKRLGPAPGSSFQVKLGGTDDLQADGWDVAQRFATEADLEVWLQLVKHKLVKRREGRLGDHQIVTVIPESPQLGYDGEGFFHSGGCAQRYARAVARASEKAGRLTREYA